MLSDHFRQSVYLFGTSFNSPIVVIVIFSLFVIDFFKGNIKLNMNLFNKS